MFSTGKLFYAVCSLQKMLCCLQDDASGWFYYLFVLFSAIKLTTLSSNTAQYCLYMYPFGWYVTVYIFTIFIFINCNYSFNYYWLFVVFVLFVSQFYNSVLRGYCPHRYCSVFGSVGMTLVYHQIHVHLILYILVEFQLLAFSFSFSFFLVNKLPEDVEHTVCTQPQLSANYNVM